ncbi:SAR2788 family putative toxin [Bacillus sp. FSL L8-0215]|uniref:SAR2788 family putative toxin n=1 Tax=Bacillus TaxID=1386 RepID=UPI000AC62421|nr:MULTISPECIES: SAR2788 family putative toxin [Bacillus]MCY7469149.1 SAR2788 family putative toxin [Bacillus safensis]MCY7480185.1 SAR2788 family putative toxin [Bacillus safensis]MCY7512851.1 SAR2788 family putative toxin [Bacillus safensis]MCY7541728.1 SAR2788 family putative toxin [Bacillus safensis]MCY7550562.1 SAR2788 family putative toxin [Bacillus safensis]
MNKISKLISIVICLSLVITLFFQFPNKTEAVTTKDFHVLEDSNEKYVISQEQDGVTGILTLNKKTTEISYQTEEIGSEGEKVSKDYEVDLQTLLNDNLDVTFKDTKDDKKYEVNSEDIQASFAFVIPIGIAIGAVLLEHLLALGLAVTVVGVTYIAYSEFIKRKDNKHNHFIAYRDKDKPHLFIGKGVSRANAVKRLAQKKDTWSTSKSNAQSIAKAASPIGKVIGAEIDKKGKNKHYHYHPVYKLKGKYERTGAHAFFGAPR